MKRILASFVVGAMISVAATCGADEVTKTWALTIPDKDNGGCTNNALVVLSDGNYELNAWIINASQKTLGIGNPTDTNDVRRALRKDSDGKYIGSGVLDMRGSISVGGVESEWKVTSIGGNAFKGSSLEEAICPTTLTSMGTATFQNSWGLKRLTIHAPNLTGDLPNNTFTYTKLNYLDLKIPKVTCLGAYWNHGSFQSWYLKDVDVSEWDLSSVQMIATTGGGKKTDTGWILQNAAFKGTMRLPTMKWLNPRSFENCKNLNALEVGRNGTLEYVGRFAAANCDALGSIVLGGKSSGWEIATNAFNSANITNVTFLTIPPTYEGPYSIIFGTEETEARQIAFYIPRRITPDWHQKWGRIVTSARSVTDEEREEFIARFGETAAQGLVGIVPPKAFRTANEQWLVCGFSPDERFTVKASLFDPRYNEDSVVISPAPDADGYYAPGTEVTITATANAEEGQFVRWRGKGVSEAEEMNNPLVVTIDRNIDITAQMAHDWTFRLNDPDAGFVNNAKGTISNRAWKLNVTVTDAAAKEIQFGTGTAGSAWTDTGDGMLDLNGRIFMELSEGQRQELTITDYNGQCFRGPKLDSNTYIEPARYPHTIVMRENLTVNPGQAFRGHWDARVTNFIYECSGFVGKLETDYFNYFNIKTGRFRLPGMTRVPSSYDWSFSADVSDWRFDSVTDVVGEIRAEYGVNKGMFANMQFTGTLYLPALAVVQTNAFRAAAKFEAIELGSNTVVTSIGSRAFNGCSSLARIRIRAGKELTVGEEAFTGTTKLKTFEFTYEMPTDPVVVDNMLVGSEGTVVTSDDPPIIYASRLMGWNSGKTERIRNPTDAEMAARPFWVRDDSSLIGVWLNADNEAIAWVVNVASKDDPKGTIFIIR